MDFLRSLPSTATLGPMWNRLVSSCLLGVPLAAQVDKLPIQYRFVRVDSGYRDHAGTDRRVVFKRDVIVSGAAWMRLYFDRTNLPAGSELRLTSRLDGAVQRHDANTLRDYGDSSAYFNGDRVTVELLAAPRTRANRVFVHEVEFVMASAGAPGSICGRTDDRKLSQDPRVGRAVSGASACTWWLIDEFTILSAGHCVSNPGRTIIIGFNIPLSTSNGTYVQPPPADQYPMDVSTLRTGSDWAVIAANRNSNHGLYPGQKQGAWFKLGKVPACSSAVTIRITGNGRVSSPVSPTWNAVQKTHTGPCVQVTSSLLRYRTDTTGGNSGSPIIHDQTGEAIGIHTNGGCTSSGGRNTGWRIDLPGLQSAIRNVRGSKVAGSLRTFGTGCGSPSATLALSGIPDVGGQVDVRVSGLPSQSAGWLFLGGSDTSWQGLRLPLDLRLFGFVGCRLYTSIDIQVAVGTGNGTVLQRYPVPNMGSLIGIDVYLQFAASASATVVFSNGGHVHVGG